MSESEFRKIINIGTITKVESHWDYITVDTAREWLTVTNSAGIESVLPDEWKYVFSFVGRSSIPGLFDLTNLGRRMLKTIEEIDTWEENNAAERAEYDRLKIKFND
jgi:hypothetical protein